MKDETINRLEQIFEGEKRARIKKENEFEQLRNKQQEFVRQFQQVRKDIIEPKMLEFKAILIENGYGIFISSTDEDLTEKGFKSQCNINFEISRNATSEIEACERYPHIMFIANKKNFNVIIHEDTIFSNRGGLARMKSRSYGIDQITEEIVELEIAESLENILKMKHWSIA